MIRVIAGRAKGKRLKVPVLRYEKRVRPLSDYAKGAAFNILGAKVVNSHFLDLFAGSGSVGIEALSRGAEIAIFVELEPKCVEIIRQNLETTELSDRAEVFRLDVRRAIKVLGGRGSKFDIIFLGAPYGSNVLEEAVKKISESKIVKDDGIVIAEHRKNKTLMQVYDSLIRFREERYGDTVLSFYKLEVL